jgi:hypothetical protein
MCLSKVLFVALGALFVAQVHAGLVFVDFIDTSSAGFGPEGITVDRATGEILFVGSHNFEDGEESVGGTSTLVRITADGFVSTQINLGGVEGIYRLGHDSYRISNSGDGDLELRLFEIDGQGTVQGDQLDLIITGIGDDHIHPDGVFAFAADSDSDRGAPADNLWVADDSHEMVYTFNSDGELLSSFETESISPEFEEPEGIEIDPISGNLLIADDSGGLSRVIELTLQGALVQSFDMQALTSEIGGFDDPEGLFVREAGGTTPIVGFDDDNFGHLLLVAFDNQEAIGIFSIEPGAAGSSHLLLPEPGTLALLFAAMAGTLLVPRRHRSRRA